ncbi:hypothetical protein KBD69_03630 [Candidatus Woesebacteria bacterium]|nr:hypothetical protein [Candidatus Woesebacteria bacterium]
MSINIEGVLALATVLGQAYVDSVRSIPTDEVDAFGWVGNISTILMMVADTDGFNLNHDENALLLLYLSSANAVHLLVRSEGEYKKVFETVKKDADTLASKIVLKNYRHVRAGNIQELAGAISNVIWQSPRDSGSMLDAIDKAVKGKAELFK